jgi:hypothetical protein
MTIFDQLDNVLGNYAEGKAAAEDVVRVAHEVSQLLVALEPAGYRYRTPHGWVVTKTSTSSDSEALYALKLTEQ